MSLQSHRRRVDVRPTTADVDSLLVVSEHLPEVTRVVIRSPEPDEPPAGISPEGKRKGVRDPRPLAS